MTSNRFSIRKSDIDSSSVFLYGEEHHHLSHVVRIKPREEVWLFDETGTRYFARVEEIAGDRTRLSILKKERAAEPRVKITLAQALIRSKKMNSVLQKATEMGATSIVPVITARTIIRLKERSAKKLERWKKIIQEAAKQSKIPFLPVLSPPVSLEKLIEERDEAKKLVLSENKGIYLKDILVRSSGPGDKENEPPPSVIILVGPEGGWTDEEEEYILSHGYEAVSLGPHIMRAETAALASLAMVSHFWNL